MENTGSLSLVGCVLILAACAQTNCREARHGQSAEAPSASSGSPSTKPVVEGARPIPLADQVKIYKLDGSLQCEQGRGTSLEVMKKELGVIKVISMSAKPDGLMRIQQCGQPTGMSNVYSIERKDLPAATKLGFKEWTKD